MGALQPAVTEQLHRLLDSGAAQSVINERMAGLHEGQKILGTDHEKRIRQIEQRMSYWVGGFGAIAGILGILALLMTIFKAIGK
jgi:hypothetical protein